MNQLREIDIFPVQSAVCLDLESLKIFFVFLIMLETESRSIVRSWLKVAVIAMTGEAVCFS